MCPHREADTGSSNIKLRRSTCQGDTQTRHTETIDETFHDELTTIEEATVMNENWVASGLEVDDWWQATPRGAVGRIISLYGCDDDTRTSSRGVSRALERSNTCGRVLSLDADSSSSIEKSNHPVDLYTAI